MVNLIKNIFDSLRDKKNSGSPEELSRRDLLVCSVRYRGCEIEPHVRYWSDESGNYVSNPTDLDAILLHASLKIQKRES